MLTISQQSCIYRFFAIDPGSDTLGLSIFDLNTITKRLSIVDVTTVSAARMSRDHFDINDIHGNKTARLLAHKDMLYQSLINWFPQAIICESSYMGKFAHAFGVGIETMTYLKQAAYEYNPYMPFETIDPSSAKKALKASIKGKDSVRESILALVPSEIDYYGSVPIQLLDEHSIDSIAIGYYKYKQLLQFLR